MDQDAPEEHDPHLLDTDSIHDYDDDDDDNDSHEKMLNHDHPTEGNEGIHNDDDDGVEEDVSAAGDNSSGHEEAVVEAIPHVNNFFAPPRTSIATTAAQPIGKKRRGRPPKSKTTTISAELAKKRSPSQQKQCNSPPYQRPLPFVAKQSKRGIGDDSYHSGERTRTDATANPKKRSKTHFAAVFGSTSKKRGRPKKTQSQSSSTPVAAAAATTSGDTNSSEEERDDDNGDDDDGTVLSENGYFMMRHTKNDEDNVDHSFDEATMMDFRHRFNLKIFCTLFDEHNDEGNKVSMKQHASKNHTSQTRFEIHEEMIWLKYYKQQPSSYRTNTTIPTQILLPLLRKNTNNDTTEDNQSNGKDENTNSESNNQHQLLLDEFWSKYSNFRNVPKLRKRTLVPVPISSSSKQTNGRHRRRGKKYCYMHENCWIVPAEECFDVINQYYDSLIGSNKQDTAVLQAQGTDHTAVPSSSSSYSSIRELTDYLCTKYYNITHRMVQTFLELHPKRQEQQQQHYSSHSSNHNKQQPVDVPKSRRTPLPSIASSSSAAALVKTTNTATTLATNPQKIINASTATTNNHTAVASAEKKGNNVAEEGMAPRYSRVLVFFVKPELDISGSTTGPSADSIDDPSVELSMMICIWEEQTQQILALQAVPKRMNQEKDKLNKTVSLLLLQTFGHCCGFFPHVIQFVTCSTTTANHSSGKNNQMMSDQDNNDCDQEEPDTCQVDASKVIATLKQFYPDILILKSTIPLDSASSLPKPSPPYQEKALGMVSETTEKINQTLKKLVAKYNSTNQTDLIRNWTDLISCIMMELNQEASKHSKVESSFCYRHRHCNHYQCPFDSLGLSVEQKKKITTAVDLIQVSPNYDVLSWFCEMDEIRAEHLSAFNHSSEEKEDGTNPKNGGSSSSSLSSCPLFLVPAALQEQLLEKRQLFLIQQAQTEWEGKFGPDIQKQKEEYIRDFVTQKMSH